MDEKIKVTFVGMEPTEALKKYAVDKLTKYENLLDKLILGEITLIENTHTRGVERDFDVTVTYQFPKTVIRVEESDSDMYAAIDMSADKLFRRLKRYHDKTQQWEGVVPWRVMEAEEALKAMESSEEDDGSYADYTPVITRRETMDDMTPLEEAEAIERMELGGRDQYLFKNIKNGKICMIFRRRRGGYGLVEPADGVE